MFDLTNNSGYVNSSEFKLKPDTNGEYKQELSLEDMSNKIRELTKNQNLIQREIEETEE